MNTYKKCNHKMIKTSDFTYEEIIEFLDGRRKDCALVHVTKEENFFGSIVCKKSIQFRKIQEVNNNKVKLFGLKNVFEDGKVQIKKEKT